MAPEALEYSTKELTKDTLPDFERLFEKHPAPGAFMCWCMYHQRARPLAVSKQQHSRVKEAARKEIRSKGGGLVEAYPIIRWGAYREYLGTVSMFQKEGFKIVAPFGKSNVVMRRKIKSGRQDVGPGFGARDQGPRG